jgi:hypothetical protein
MTDPYDPLVYRDVTIRREQQRNLKTSQQKEMEFRQVNRDANSFHQSVDATNDHYMKNALSKVRESKVTLPDELTRIHGTYTTTIK